MVLDGLRQSYSPDGTKYIRTNDVILGEPFRVDIYDFDRCTGQLSNQRTKFLDYPGFGVGIAVSPDSRYLYVMRTTKAFQYDLTAADIFATETLVAEWDGFISGAVYGLLFPVFAVGSLTAGYTQHLRPPFTCTRSISPTERGWPAISGSTAST
ncbi:MAG: hypothetical protein H6565_10050 [Lewinellaceae bacterium]|nr:hypothetical protein [Lewinellaceae bacterium]